MKKIKVLLLMVSLLVSTFSAEAQKSGILQKHHYGAFNGDQWEEFLAGKNADEFEKKSNVTLKNYLQNVERFVREELKEPTIASAVMNSTVVTFPQGSDVYTADADGNWKTRKAYPGEQGYLHTQTNMCWLSFSCGNLVASRFFGNPTTPSVAPAQPYKKPAQKEDEYVYYPGTKKVIVYGSDTVDITRTKVQIETNNNNKLVFNNTQSYEMDMTNHYASNKQYSDDCNCSQQKRQVNCGCNGRDMCQDHFDRLPKEKKNFFNTAGGRILTHLLAAGAGYGARMIVENNRGTGRSVIPTRRVEQPPLDILPTTRVIEQPPLMVFN